MEELLEEATHVEGCKVGAIAEKDAQDFLDKVVAMYQVWEAGDSTRKPSFSQVARILKREWGINISRRIISDHVRGECKCQRK